MPYSLVINPLNAPPCTLCLIQSDWGATFTWHLIRKDERGNTIEHKVGGTITLCAPCLEEVGREYIDELLFDGDKNTIATVVDQLILRLHRNN